MLTKLNETMADSGSTRRFGAYALTAGVIAVNKKLNLGLGLEDIGALVALSLGYITQSMVKEKADAAGAAAAIAIIDNRAAADALGGKVVP